MSDGKKSKDISLLEDENLEDFDDKENLGQADNLLVLSDPFA